MNDKLSPELISLVHHVELNKSGWWEKSMQQLILSALSTVNDPLNAEEIEDLLRTTYSSRIDREKLRKVLERLRKSFEIISPKQDYFILPETVRIKYKDQLKGAEKLEENVEKFFIDLTKNHSIELDGESFWGKFCSEYLYPLIKEIGADTYNLINGNSPSVDSVRFDNFLKTFPKKDRDQIRKIINDFMTSDNKDVRSFILRSLNAYFFVEATNLREESLIALSKATKKSIIFTVFIDTNLLVAILGLKESVDQAGKLLLDLVKQLSGKVQIKLSVLPITLDETRNLLANKKAKLSNLRLSSVLLDAGLDMGLDEIDAKFIQTYQKTGISADDYFEDYLSDLVTVVREKSVIFRNESTDSYTMREDVIDDINVQLDYEKERFKKEAKSYEKLKHDIVLWHFVNDNRSAHIESPLAAEQWILTFDSRLRAFDNHKKNAAGNSVPLCLHPLTFTQMLQFWIPRTPEFEEAILTSLRIPFLSQEFDARSQQVTLDILRALSKYQNIETLKKDTITEILMNKALRHKISIQKDEKEQFDSVEGALIKKYQEVEKKLEEERKEKELLANETRQTNTAKLELQSELGQQRQEIDYIKKQLETEKREKAKLQEGEETRKERSKFRNNWVIYPIIVISLFGLLLGLIISRFTNNYLLISLLIWLPSLLGIIRIIDWKGSKKENIKDWTFYKYLHNFRKILYWLLGIAWTLIAGALGTPIWEWVKNNINNG
jgi:uncharacterized membrane protein